jgi:WD40 repeat protein
MARLFISHSSRNNDKAIEVRDWLAANGWDDVFLDLDPERGIVAGQRWKEALQQAASRCEVVLALVSAEWLASSYCKAEINTAQMMGKKTIIALIDKSQVPGDLTDEQFIDLSGDPQAYRRLKKGLELAGLDPLSFPFEPGRRPYPGFAYFEEQDVAVFFGRDAQIVRGLDELRRLVRTGVSRMLVILGASGSGKSSFLRAGLWPRLKRDDRAWLPLPIIRPERAVISGTYGLAGSLHQIISEAPFAGGFRQRGLPRSRADIEEFIKTEDGLAKLFDALRDIGQVPGLSGEIASPPTIVLALDQGEELFNDEGRDEAERFVEILTRTLNGDRHTLALLAMRSDSFPLVQAHPSLAALPKDTFTLDMMLEGSYRAVIEDPARLIQPTPLRIDPQLTEALLKEISGQDALPLLAFTLAHLYENYAADNELTLVGYDKLGHVRGVIDTAVTQAFAAGVAKGELPKDAKAQLALARAAFIPHLAQVNAAGQFVRRVATLGQIPAEARPLIDSFAEQRLLIKDRRKDADGKDVDVVEVAHETLLRQPPFSEWLEEDREFLIGKQQLQNDLRDWAEAKPADKNGALLAGLKLSRMRAWLEARPQDLTPQERDFGQASIAHADADERRKARQRRNITRGSIAAAVVLACFAVTAGWQWKIANGAKVEAQYQTQLATKAKDQADENAKQAESERDKAHVQLLAVQARREATDVTSADAIERAGALALASIAKSTGPPEADAIEAARSALSLLPLRVLSHGGGRVTSLVMLPDGRLASGGEDGKIKLWPKEGGGEPQVLSQNSRVFSLAVLPDGRLASGSVDGNIKIWPKDGTGTPMELSQGSPVWSLAVLADGRLASCGDGPIKLWPKEGIGAPVTLVHGGRVVSLAVLADGRLASGGHDGTIKLWSKEGAGAPMVLSQAGGLYKLAALADGRLASGGGDGTIKIWPKDGVGVPVVLSHGGAVMSLAVLIDGRLASGGFDSRIKLWPKEGTGELAVVSPGSPVQSLAVLADGRLASGGDDGNIKIWPKEVTSEPVILWHGGRVWALAALADGRLASGTDSAIKIWPREGAPVILPQHSPLWSLAVLTDGRLASGPADGKISLWPKDFTGEPAVLSQGHQLGSFSSLVGLADGRLAIGGADGKIRLWPKDFADEPVVLTHGGQVSSLAVLKDGRLASGGTDGTVKLWPREGTGEPVVLSHGSQLTSLAGLTDGRLASGGRDGTIKVWPKEGNGEPVVLSHGSQLTSMAGLADGRLASGGRDGTIKVWPKEGNGEPVVLSHGNDVWSLAVLADGRLASGGEGGQIKLWLVDEKKLIAALCLRAGRNLTKDEWARYIGSDTPWQPSCRSFGVPSNWRTVDENKSGLRAADGQTAPISGPDQPILHRERGAGG